MEKKITPITNTKPPKISWIVDSLHNGSSASLVLSNYQVQNEEKKSNVFGVCAAPGKNLAKGRDGKTHQRDIEADVKFYRDNFQIDIIVCLLNKYELRTIGVDLDKYQRVCEINGIQLIVYPVVEMGVPTHSPEEFDAQMMNSIFYGIMNSKRVICHCRGGIGRAGTVASCLLIKAKLCRGSKSAISTVRTLRDPKCVESRKQEDFIDKYNKLIMGPSAKK